MKIIVTGGFGFIGSNFVSHCLNTYADMQILNIDSCTYAASPENLSEHRSDSRLNNLRTDICDILVYKRDMEKFRPDYIVNFAAESHVDRSISNSTPFVRSNILGTAHMLELCRILKPRKYIQVGTDEVYGSLSLNESPSVESDILRPRSPYAASKASADLLALAYFHTYGPADCPVIVTRSCNNYGPRQHPEKAVPLMITNWLTGKEFPMYGDGLNIREWIYVEDNVRAIFSLMVEADPGNIYNIGSGVNLTNEQLTLVIGELMFNGPAPVKHVVDRLGHDRRYALNSSKLNSLYQEPCCSLQDAMCRTVEWYKFNEPWWRRLKV